VEVKTTLILGGARSVWDDAAAATALAEPDAVFAVNDIGTRWAGPVRAWCTLHPEHMARWRAERARRGFPAAFEHVGHETGQPGIDRVTGYLWPGMNASGSSGLFAVKVAMESEFDRIILAGVPMQAEGAHFFNASPWGEVASFIEAWKIAMPLIAPHVRSMSGWTRQLLGCPSAEWLAGDPQPHMAG
jgi:hypothetical protein